MNSLPAMRWFRTRQRALTRVVLALFCLAWLQAAAVPCVMAHGSVPVSDAPAQAAHHCQYCPPEAQGAGGDHDDSGRCLYPHADQVDSRATPALFLAMPAAPVVFRLEPVILMPADPGIARAVPILRPPLSDSLCRRIE